MSGPVCPLVQERMEGVSPVLVGAGGARLDLPPILFLTPSNVCGNLLCLEKSTSPQDDIPA